MECCSSALKSFEDHPALREISIVYCRSLDTLYKLGTVEFHCVGSFRASAQSFQERWVRDALDFMMSELIGGDLHA